MRLQNTLPKDLDGYPVPDPLSFYQVSNGPTAAEAADDIQYFLGVAHDGSWHIRKRTISTGTERFCRGMTDYVTAWADRASQTYDYFDVIF
jgi:hypothetical protein